MKTSAAGVQAIAGFEGVVTRAYRDVGGVWTIGVGHTAAAGGIKPGAGMTITRDQAFSILADDLAGCEGRVTKRMGNTWQSVFDGSVSFDFNTGAILTASWVAKFLAGDNKGARESFLTWDKVGKQDVAGLETRRVAEAVMIFGHESAPADAPAASPVAPVDAAPAPVWPLLPADAAKLKALGYSDVSAFQTANGLVVDGIAGPATLATLARRYNEHRAVIVIVSGAAGSGTVTGAMHSGAHALNYGVAQAVAFAVVGVTLFLIWHFRGAIKHAVLPAKKVVA